ncbi:MAG TPA: alpha/beta hydrolase [Acidimicrobiales bacterium]
MNERTVAVNGIDLHLLEDGKPGDPLVLLCHGFPELAWSWRHQLPALAAAGYHVVAPDQRGYGGSSCPEAIEDYDIVHLTDDLLALLDHLGEEQAVVVGHDWGAMVLTHLVLRAPERVRGAMWMSVPFVPRPPAPPTAIFKQLFTDTWFYMLYFQEPGVADADLGADPRKTMRRFLHTASAEAPVEELTGLVSARDGRGFVDRLVDPEKPSAWLTDEELDVYVANFEKTGFTGGINWYRNLDRNWALTAEHDGARVTMPAAFLGGKADPVLLMSPPQGMEAWCDEFRGITLVEGAGHWVQQEKPSEVNEALLQFLSELG